MVFTILLFYGCGLAMDRAVTRRGKRLWLAVSVVISLGLLGIFKYADFFITNFNALTGLSVPLLRVTLPISAANVVSGSGSGVGVGVVSASFTYCALT